MIKEFDPDQQQAIHSLTNTVVTAGAGSGKTSVLAARFVWLLKSQKIAIDEILTLTFTNKAAAEMYEKIYLALQNETDAHLRDQLAGFHKAQISTIDSFSAHIVKNSAALFGLPEDFESDEDKVFSLASELAMDFFLSHSHRPGVEAIVKKFGLDGLINDLLVFVAGNIISLAHDIDFPALIRHQYASLEKLLTGALDCFENSAVRLSGPEFDRFKTVRDNKEILIKAITVRESILSGSYPAAQKLLAGLSYKKPPSGNSEENLALRELIDELRTSVDRILAIIDGLAQRSLVEDLFFLLGEFQHALQGKKRDTGIVSFRDVADMAVQALVKNKALREYYKKKFRFIMIDEFQDNNRLQKELLFLLAEKQSLSLDRVPDASEIEPDKLFFVGDEKQSIYAFRGAQVDVFKALKKEIEKHGGRVISLANNYRSAPGLVGFYNRVFERVMAGTQADFEAEFEPLKKSVVQGTKPSLFLFYKAYEEKDGESDYSACESEAFALACFIRESVETGALTVRQDGATRQAGYGDFALLMRSTSNQIIYERMFRQQGVPYVTQNVRSLFMEPPVNDMYSLLETALHPDDRVAYATLLRSPFVHVSDHALIDILSANQAPFAEISLDDEDAAKYLIGRERCQFIRERIDRVPISSLVFHAWHDFGYRYFIMHDPSAGMYLEYYDYFFALASAADDKNESLEKFLAWVRTNLGQYEKLEEIEYPAEAHNSVHIMTIHKAKGLEFPVVICSDLGNRGRNTDRNAPCSASDEYGLIINLGGKSYFSEASREQEDRRELAEAKRLFYVALTRARDHLVLSGVHNRQNRRSAKVHLSMLFDSLGLESDNFVTLASSDYDSHVIQIPELTKQDVYKELPVKKRNFDNVVRQYESLPGPKRTWRRVNYSVSELNEIRRTGFDDETWRAHSLLLPDLAVDGYLDTDEARARWGSLVHYVLSQKLLGRYSPVLVPLSLKSGFEHKVYDALLAEAVRLADQFISSEWGQLALNAEECETEFPFLYRYRHLSLDYFILGTIDLFFTAGDRVHLIDFKTDRRLNRLDYEVQLGIYAAALAEHAGKPVTAMLYSLRNGQVFKLNAPPALDALFSIVAAGENHYAPGPPRDHS